MAGRAREGDLLQGRGVALGANVLDCCIASLRWWTLSVMRVAQEVGAVKPTKIGRWGEDLVARILGYTRVPFSGSVWPHKQDLVSERRASSDGHAVDDIVVEKEIAQVKTTESEDFLEQWKALSKHARVEGAIPRWFDVVKAPNEAYIFERRLVRVIRLGVGGEY